MSEVNEDFEYEEVADLSFGDPDLRTGHKPVLRALVPRCPARNDRHTCYLMEHTTPVHVDLAQGWLEVWSLPNDSTWRNEPTTPADPLADAPEALRD